MLQRDYLVRMIAQFIEAIVKSMQKVQKEQRPEIAADMLDAAIGEATDIDGSILLSLAPESMVSIMQVSGTDPHVTSYIAHSLFLSSYYAAQAGDVTRAELREQQARAVALAYGVDLPESYSEAEMNNFLESQEG